MPFERQLKGEEDKPLPPSKPRKQYKRSPENRGSKPESKKKRKMEREECEVSRKKMHLNQRNSLSNVQLGLGLCYENFSFVTTHF